MLFTVISLVSGEADACIEVVILKQKFHDMLFNGKKSKKCMDSIVKSFNIDYL